MVILAKSWSIRPWCSSSDGIHRRTAAINTCKNSAFRSSGLHQIKLGYYFSLEQNPLLYSEMFSHTLSFCGYLLARKRAGFEFLQMCNYATTVAKTLPWHGAVEISAVAPIDTSCANFFWEPIWCHGFFLTWSMMIESSRGVEHSESYRKQYSNDMTFRFHFELQGTFA